MTVPVSLRIALRDLRGSLGAFRIFLACLALGVFTIAALGSLGASLEAGIAREGRTILDGDLEMRLVQRAATPEEQAFLREIGTVSTVATLRAMARSEADTASATLIEIKAVDGTYPLVGTVDLTAGLSVNEALQPVDGEWAIAVDPILLARLDAAIGDTLVIGDIEAVVTAEILREPDRLSGGFLIGPRVLMTAQALDATGLVQPGSLMHWHYRLDLGPGAGDDKALRTVIDRVETEMPDAGWRLRSRMNAAPTAQRFVDRLGFFMTLAGLTALIVGGVGVANAVRNYLDTRIATIATLKCLGASGGTIFRVYLAQVLILAGIAIALALAAGAVLPLIGLALFGHLLPAPAIATIHWPPLLVAAAFGILITLAFTLLPLGRARDIAGATLFRSLIAPAAGRPPIAYMAAIAVAVIAAGALALTWYSERLITIYYLAGTILSFALLWALARGMVWTIRRTLKGQRPETRLAFRNMVRPGTPAPSVILSLGLGLALIVTLALIDSNLTRELRTSVPDRAPSFFFVDIQSDQVDDLTDLVVETAPAADFETVPMLRGHIAAVKSVDAADVEADPDVRWVLRGDRGLTYSETPPDGSRITSGTWWPADYAGPPLVSLVDDVAAGLGIGVGDEITVNVLGRPLTAEIANLRTVEWESLGINFVLVFSPSALAAAPHTHLATVTMDEAGELDLLRAVSAAMPNVTIVRMKEAIETVTGFLERLLTAIRSVSLMSLLMSVLVLAGALASGYRARLYDAAVYKTLGATRRTILTAHLIEYAGYGLVTAGFALVAGTIAAYAVMTFVMDLPWAFNAYVALGAAVAATAITVVLGLATSWRTLGAKPARLLRTN